MSVSSASPSPHEEMPEGGGLGRCQVGVVKRSGEWQAGGALPRAAVAGKGGSSGRGGAGPASPSDPVGWPEGEAWAISLGEYVCLSLIKVGNLGSRV